MSYGSTPYGGGSYGGGTVVQVAGSVDVMTALEGQPRVLKFVEPLWPTVQEMVSLLDESDLIRLVSVARRIAQTEHSNLSLEEQIRQLHLLWESPDVGSTVDPLVAVVEVDLGPVVGLLDGAKTDLVDIALPANAGPREREFWIAAGVLWIGAILGAGTVGAAFEGDTKAALILGSLFALLLGMCQLADRLP